MAANRNEPCPCGSGRKFKHCCAGKQPWYRKPTWSGALVALVLAVSLLVVGMALVRSDGSTAPGNAPPGKVWSEEHGHWHDAP